jgi:hypothetical protein
MIDDLKALEKFFKICRKQGVTEISCNGISVKYGDLPQELGNSSEETEEIPSDGLSPEQLMFYAVEKP